MLLYGGKNIDKISIFISSILAQYAIDLELRRATRYQQLPN